MNFQEKSAWACFSAICFTFTPYFWVVLRHPQAFAGLFVLATIALVGILTVFHAINAATSRAIRASGKTPVADELDVVIELKATKLSAMVLGVVVLGWSVAAMYGFPANGVRALADATTGDAVFAIPVSQALIWVHLLFAGFVLANLTYYGQIIFSYRRMLHG